MATTEELKYQKFIENSIKNREVWLLQAYTGMYAMLDDLSGTQYMPVWDDEQDAVNYAKDDWSEYQPDRMGIGEFISWLDELEADLIKIAVAPFSDSQIIPQKAKTLKKHLLEEQG